MGGEISNAIIALEKTKLKAIDSLQIVFRLTILPDLQMVCTEKQESVSQQMIHILFHSRISKKSLLPTQIFKLQSWQESWLYTRRNGWIYFIAGGSRRKRLTPILWQPLYIHILLPSEIGTRCLYIVRFYRKYFPVLDANDTNNEQCNFVHIVSPLFNELKIDSCFSSSQSV